MQRQAYSNCLLLDTEITLDTGLVMQRIFPCAPADCTPEDIVQAQNCCMSPSRTKAGPDTYSMRTVRSQFSARHSYSPGTRFSLMCSAQISKRKKPK